MGPGDFLLSSPTSHSDLCNRFQQHQLPPWVWISDTGLQRSWGVKIFALIHISWAIAQIQQDDRLERPETVLMLGRRI